MVSVLVSLRRSLDVGGPLADGGVGVTLRLEASLDRAT